MTQNYFKSVVPLGQNRGQIIIEYLLILVVAVTMATFITTQLVGRGEDEGGIIINKWVEMNQLIGEDTAD